MIASGINAAVRIVRSNWDDITYLNVLCVVITALQIALGWLFRYEAYLVVLGLVIVAITFRTGRSMEKVFGSWSGTTTGRRPAVAEL